MDIGNAAFYYCSRLRGIIVLDSVTCLRLQRSDTVVT